MSKPDRYFVTFESKAKIEKLTCAVEDADPVNVFDDMDAGDDLALALKLAKSLHRKNGGHAAVHERTDIVYAGWDDEETGHHFADWDYDVEHVCDWNDKL